MKILYVVHDFFPRFFGGTERYVLNIAKQMQRMGHSVQVLTYGVADPTEEYSVFNGILLKKYNFEGIKVTSVRHKNIPADHGYRISDDILDDMVTILKNERLDLIHVAHPMRMTSVIGAAKQIDIPVVLTITDFWLLCARGRFFKPDYSLCNSSEGGSKCRLQCGVDDSIFKRIINAKKLFDTVDARIAPSRFLIEIFKENKWDKPIHHINHGIDYRYVRYTPRKREPNNKLTFAYLGVVGRFKGIDLLLNSFSMVDSQEIRLDIYGNCVGDDGTIDLLHKAANEDQRIRIMGRFTHDELPHILSQVDVVVVPSTTLESYGLVVIESLAYQVPVIASDIVGSAYEFIQHGKNGMIFAVQRPSELLEIMQKLTDAPYLVETLKSNIIIPPHLEEEAFKVEQIYKSV